MRQILGTHVRQAGSLVTDTSFRFDFSHFEKISEAQLWEIERLCAEKILENKTVSVTESRFEDRPPDGLAFFGDQYGDTVRVVRIDGCGAELCGGTHLQTTGQLGWIKILQESSVAAGTRRIEAIVGESAYQKAHQLWSSARKLEILFSRPLDQIPDQCKELLRQKNRYESRAKMTSIPSFSIFRDGIVEGLRWKAVGTKEKSPDTVRSLGKQKFTQEKLDILLIQTMGTDREGLFVFCSPLAIGKGYSAHRLVQKCLASLGGRGGGKPDFATGGLRTTVPSKFRWEEIIQHGRAE
ncbi:MAG: hypothetical protein LBR62_02160 [Puniceicoccales bacterium]|nr:hypothetical protein [Puniceicoccales bacterium]